MWGDLELLDKRSQEMIGRGEMVYGGDAISCDEKCRPMNKTCLSCKHEWYSPADGAEA
jgi:hypothetical protein